LSGRRAPRIDGIMIAELARFSLGRVLLHLISMLGDRAVRFHAAGIMRELSWVAEATALLARVCAIWQQAARVLRAEGVKLRRFPE
jgi:hypothetical protein